MKRFTIGLTGLLIFSLGTAGSAQSGGGFELTSSTIDGGGDTFTVGGSFRLGSTIGQPDVGSSVGGTFALSGGFQPGLCGGEVFSYGAGTAGSGGFVPQISFTGCPSLGDTLVLNTTSALGGTAGLLVTGTSQVSVSFLGGTLLTFPIVNNVQVFLGGAVGVPGAGSGSKNVPVPNNSALVGLTVYFQAGFFDPGGPANFSFTNGLAVAFG